jgi:hypothetical protein
VAPHCRPPALAFGARWLIGQIAELAFLTVWEGKTVNPQYGNTPGGPYGEPPMPQPVTPYASPKPKNTLGLIALAVSVIGFVFACIKGALVVGWVLLPIAFILGIVALFQAGKGKGTGVAAIIISVVGTVVGVAVFATAVTDSVDQAFGGSTLSASPSSAPSGSATNDSSAAGTRGNPYRIGETVNNRDWKVTLGRPHEAWAEVSATNQFNEPPKAGMEFWIVPVTAVYTGDATGNVAVGVDVKFVGSDNRTYEDRCGVIPNSLTDIGDLYKNGVAQGNTCVAVPAGADGLWTVTAGFIAKPVFFAAR